MRDSADFGWATKPLGDIVDVLDKLRKPITKSDRIAGPYPYYGATGVLDYVDGYLFDEDLVLIGEDGAKWEAGANSAFSITGKTWVNNHAHVIRPHRDEVLDDWLIYYLNGADLMPFVSGMTVPKLNQGRLREIPIPLPPLEEQQRIVAVLDEAFEGLARAHAHAEANLQNARELRQSVLADAYEGRFSGAAAKAEWKIETLGAIFEIGSSKRVLQRQWQKEGVPFYRAREIVKLARQGSVENDLFISEEHFAELKETHGVPSVGDLMVSAVGTLGACYVVQPSDKFYFKDASVLRFHPKINVCSRFYQYAFQWDGLLDTVKESDGATVGTLTISRAKGISVPLPPLEEQQRIVSVLDETFVYLDAVREGFTAKLQDLDDLRQSLLQKAFAGELT